MCRARNDINESIVILEEIKLSDPSISDIISELSHHNRVLEHICASMDKQDTLQ